MFSFSFFINEFLHEKMNECTLLQLANTFSVGSLPPTRFAVDTLIMVNMPTPIAVVEGSLPNCKANGVRDVEVVIEHPSNFIFAHQVIATPFTVPTTIIAALHGHVWHSVDYYINVVSPL